MKPSANQGKRLHKILIMKPTKTVITDINDINYTKFMKIDSI